MDNFYVKFAVCDKRGQYQKPISIKVKMVRWHGMTEKGMLWDITHDDGTDERICISAEQYGDFKLGKSDEIVVDITIVSWAYPLHTKDEFHARVGKGMFMHPQRGHFVEEKDLPAPITEATSGAAEAADGKDIEKDNK